MKYRKPADIGEELSRTMKELTDPACELHQLWRQNKNCAEVMAAQTRANDLRAATFPSRRGKSASAPTSAFPEENPAKAGYWLDSQRQRDELNKSEIIATLLESDTTQQELIELVADILVVNLGVIESAIDNIQKHSKADGSILLPSGKYVSADAIQANFDRLTMQSALFHLLTFNESILAAKQSAKAKKGGNHGKSQEKLKAQLRKWIVKQWELPQGWASQDAFITRMRAVAPPEKAETLGLIDDAELKGWLTVKKKN